MLPFIGLVISTPQVEAQGVRNESAAAGTSGAIALTSLQAAARGLVGVTAENEPVFQPKFQAPSADVAAQRFVTAESLSINALAVGAPNNSVKADKHPIAEVDGPRQEVRAPIPNAFITDQDAQISVPLSDRIPGEDQMRAFIKQGYRGIKARGSGDTGFAIRNPQTGGVWFSSNDIVWNQIDIFEIGGGRVVSKDYSYVPGFASWEKLVLQCFMDPPPSTRKMLQYSYSWNGATLSLSGGSERTLITVLGR